MLHQIGLGGLQHCMSLPVWLGAMLARSPKMDTLISPASTRHGRVCGRKSLSTRELWHKPEMTSPSSRIHLPCGAGLTSMESD